MEEGETIVLLSKRELDKMRRVGLMAAELLSYLEPRVKSGVSTLDLNDAAEEWIQTRGVKSTALGYRGFPKSICTSVNEAVCNAIPNATQILKDGDIINITVMLQVEGYHGKTSRTFFVSEPSPIARKLVEVTEECLKRGIAAVKPGARIGDIGAAIQEYAESHGFSVVRDFVGHGIGTVLHAAPQIPHYGTRGQGKKLRPGMVFTIEPMINEGIWEVEILPDGWTVVTQDRKLSAQFEHTVAVTDDGVEILTLPVAKDIPFQKTTTDAVSGKSQSRYLNPYDVLDISSDTPMTEIPKVFARAMKSRKYPADAIAKARKGLMNPKERLIADYLRPILPTVSEFKHEDFSALEATPLNLEFLPEFDGLDGTIAMIEGVSEVDHRVGLLLSDFLNE